MSGLVEGLLGLASPWGYLVVALLAGLEAAAFVGLVIPGETAMLLGGVLAFTGRASVVVMMVCAAVGAVIWAPGFVYLGFLAGHSYQRVERAAGRAGGLLAAGLVLLAAVTLTARWVIRHPDRALAPGRRLRARPGVARLERRYAGQLQFLARRFDPAGALGLALTALVAALGLLGAGFGAVTEDVLAGEELVRVDSPVSRFLLEHREAWLTTFMEVVTRLGSAVVLVPVLITLGLIARWAQGTWRPAAFLALTLGGASLSSVMIKLLVARPRPTSGVLVEALGYAFPSGHSTAAAAVWLAAALVAGSLSRSFALRVSLLAAALLVVALVGVSRIYLGVHAATDVLGGWALGGLWLALVLTATHLLTVRQLDPTTGPRHRRDHGCPKPRAGSTATPATS